MNIYRTSFYVQCPSDGEWIKYQIEIKSGTTIMVEDLLASVPDSPQYHEVMADMLKSKLGGEQTIKATHQGVEIITTR